MYQRRARWAICSRLDIKGMGTVAATTLGGNFNMIATLGSLVTARFAVPALLALGRASDARVDAGNIACGLNWRSSCGRQRVTALAARSAVDHHRGQLSRGSDIARRKSLANLVVHVVTCALHRRSLRQARLHVFASPDEVDEVG